MNKPEVICLMMTSADGKILSAKWGSDKRVKALLDNFKKAHDTFGVPAWICGRTTMEKDFTGLLSAASPPVCMETRTLPTQRKTLQVSENAVCSSDLFCS
jgi:hypothetical protein